ncbi:HAD family hydrolase [Paraliobacillus sediminis]|uniref:HAD family hydrolase n=1 Tax=Paraliobacillus sediminis TaxID=1885916 RepID=UPI000E3CBE38|nr:HAD family hydrolase [Paraliobacillus sediminis]
MINLLFDVDDTLYDQLKPFEDAYREVFGEFNFDVSIDTLFVKSRHYSDIVFDLVTNGEIDVKAMHVYRISKAFASMGIEISEQNALLFQSYYQRNQAEIVIDPKMRDVLNMAVSKGVTLGVITNGPAAHQANKVKQLQLTNWINEKNIFISGALGISKPDKAIFNYVENKMGISPEATFYIGDSYRNDVVGAKEAGWNSIWINRRKHEIPNERKYLPDYIIDEDSRLETTLKHILEK